MRYKILIAVLFWFVVFSLQAQKAPVNDKAFRPGPAGTYKGTNVAGTVDDVEPMVWEAGLPAYLINALVNVDGVVYINASGATINTSPPGVGWRAVFVPGDGTTGQFLVKLSNDPYDFGWSAGPGGGSGATIESVTVSNDTLYVVEGGFTYFAVLPSGTVGADGEDGEDGVGVSSTAYDINTGILTITYTDNSTFSTGDLRGADGTNGTDGEDGNNGQDGADGNGIASADYNPATGVLTLTYTDNSTYSTGDLRGGDGADGQDGDDGTNGTNGTNGSDGADGEDGVGIASSNYNPATGILTITYSDNSTYSTGDLRGADGNDGVDGTNGQDGVNGEDGNGIASASYNSATGVLTLAYTDSNTFSTGDLRGTDGQDGTNGIDGEGVIPGGTTGQLYAKASNADYDGEWVDPSSSTDDQIAAEVPLDPANLMVAVESDLQAWAESVDAALLKARNTTIETGGQLSITGATTVSFAAGSGQILDNSSDPTVYYRINWAASGNIALAVTGPAITYWYVDNTGTIGQTTVPPSGLDLVTRIYLAVTSYTATASAITGAAPIVTPGFHTAETVALLSDALGVMKITGLQVAAAGTDLEFRVTAGTIYDHGSNWNNLEYDPHRVVFPEFNSNTTGTFRYATQSGVLSLDETDVDVANYQVNGAITPIPGNVVQDRFGIHYIYVFSSTNGNNYRLVYGDDFYTDLEDALADLDASNAADIAPLGFKEFGLLLGAIVVEKDETTNANFRFVTTNRFGLFGGALIAAAASDAVLTVTGDSPVVVDNSDPANPVVGFDDSKLEFSKPGIVEFATEDVGATDLKTYVQANLDTTGNTKFRVRDKRPTVTGVESIVNTDDYTAFPSITRAQNGNLILSMYSGEDHREYGRVATMLSTDNGNSWQRFQYHDDDLNNWRTLTVTTLANGNIVGVYWNRVEINPTVEGPVVKKIVSTDNGLTWSAPSLLVPEVDLPFTERNWASKIFETDAGTWLLPLYGYNSGQDVSNSVGGVFRSTDGGSTFTFIAFPDQGIGDQTETRIYEWGGTLYAYIRVNNNSTLYRTQSVDDGATWSNPVNVTPNNYANSRPDMIIDQQTGRLIFGYRHSLDGNTPYRLGFVSSDDLGDTWSDAFYFRDLATIESDNPVYITLAYGDWVEGEDGSFNFYYGWDTDYLERASVYRAVVDFSTDTYEYFNGELSKVSQSGNSTTGVRGNLWDTDRVGEKPLTTHELIKRDGPVAINLLPSTDISALEITEDGTLRFKVTSEGLIEGGHTYDLSQQLGASEDGYVATYDHAIGKVTYKQSSGGGGGTLNTAKGCDTIVSGQTLVFLPTGLTGINSLQVFRNGQFLEVRDDNGGYFQYEDNEITVTAGHPEYIEGDIICYCYNSDGVVAATCFDGIQNGDETGVDCGGPDCIACPTCVDGIQNGDETGIDCGGPDCPACPTCFDGIQNGDETGIDCGGPDCAPCGGGFAPNSLSGLHTWLDASQEAYANGQVPTVINDFSTGDHDFASASNQVAYFTNQINGEPAFTFQNDAEITNGDDVDWVFMHNAQHTTFMVADVGTIATTDQVGMWTSSNISSANIGTTMLIENRQANGRTDQVRHIVSNGSPGNFVSDNTADNYALQNGFAIYSTWADLSVATANSISLTRDELATVSTTRLNAPVSTNATSDFTIGKVNPGSTINFAFDQFAEFIVYDRVLTPAERTQVIDYLNAKYGL